LTDISPITELDNLKTLETENFESVNDFSCLSKMTNLMGLGLNGGMYSVLKLNDLKPLKNLNNLEYLQLISTRVLDKSITPLLNLKKLKCLRLASKWPDSDFELLRTNLPNLKYGNVVPDKTQIQLMKIFNKK
jgi:Leucine-rich repeat (LRR) protein